MKLALNWIADQRIEAAQQRGELENLPGEGTGVRHLASDFGDFRCDCAEKSSA